MRFTMRFAQINIIASLIVCVSLHGNAAAAGNDRDTFGGAPAGSSASTGPDQVLQSCMSELRNMALDLKQVVTAARHIYDEVVVTSATLSGEPTGTGIGYFDPMRIGPRPDGPPQPARKERVDLAMTNLNAVIAMLKKDSEDFVRLSAQIGSASASQIQPIVDEWKMAMSYLNDDYVALQQYTAGPDYQNGAIADTCQGLQNDVKALDKVKSKAFRALENVQKSVAIGE